LTIDKWEEPGNLPDEYKWADVAGNMIADALFGEYDFASACLPATKFVSHELQYI
jgi:hypothetical protein